MPNATDRVVMVSGASRGIGRAIVERLLAGGFRVSAGVRDTDSLRASDALSVHAYDARDTESPRRWVENTVSRFGRLDALVNVAGINSRFTLADADETILDELWQVNVKGPLRLVRDAWPHLRACGSGRIVNLASLSGKRVINENLGYAMTKFAVVALTQAIRREGWDDGVRATALCPGLVDTDMTQGHRAAVPPERMSDARDIAMLVETLLSLPNTASVAELAVNCRWETAY